MKLWVRSQDKMDIMKIESIHIEEIPSSEEVTILGYASGNKFTTLGYYKSKERALEIMEQINERITLLNTMALVNDRDTLIAFKRALGEDKVQGLGVPYQMPQE